MADEERVVVEDIEGSKETSEKPKKGLTIMLIIIGLVAILQCGVLFVIFQDEIMGFFENMKPEPVEVTLYHPMGEMSVNLADTDTRHFLRTNLTIEYKSEELTSSITERAVEIESKVIEILRSKKLSQIDSVEETRQLSDEIVKMLNELFETEHFSTIHFTNYLFQ